MFEPPEVLWLQITLLVAASPVLQRGGALVGWLLGATVGAGTIAVILLLGPFVDLVGRLLRLDVHQGASAANELDPASDR